MSLCVNFKSLAIHWKLIESISYRHHCISLRSYCFFFVTCWLSVIILLPVNPRKAWKRHARNTRLACQLAVNHLHLWAVQFFHPGTVNVIHHLRVFMPHLIRNKRGVGTHRQQPAGKSMSRMVRITATNASTFYSSVKSGADTGDFDGSYLSPPFVASRVEKPGEPNVSFRGIMWKRSVLQTIKPPENLVIVKKNRGK